jgi:aspartate racemase
MKVLGLIGGTGWISSAEYYRIINEEVNRRLGGHQSAKCILHAFNYAIINEMNEKNEGEGTFSLVLDAA